MCLLDSKEGMEMKSEVGSEPERALVGGECLCGPAQRAEGVLVCGWALIMR